MSSYLVSKFCVGKWTRSWARGIGTVAVRFESGRLQERPKQLKWQKRLFRGSVLGLEARKGRAVRVGQGRNGAEQGTGGHCTVSTVQTLNLKKGANQIFLTWMVPTACPTLSGQGSAVDWGLRIHSSMVSLGVANTRPP